MNILFVSISSLPHLSENSISLDIIHELKNKGHKVFVLSALESRDNTETNICEENGCTVLRVKIGNNKRAGLIEKGITTLMLPYKYIFAIKRYYRNIKFDLVIYPTPPVTQFKTVNFVKKRDNAKTYLLLKDIFPQNAVDLKMLSKRGIMGLIYKYFRLKEKRLYSISDKIGCMSKANVEYLLAHNPKIDPKKVEVFPNCINPVDRRVSAEEKTEIRKKYGLPLDKKLFIYGGNLGKPQDVPFIVECVKKCEDMENAYFVIVGNGTHKELIEAYIENNNPKNVVFFDYMPKTEYEKVTACMDVGLVFLDHRFTIPNFPSRILSYMQAGLPVLACTDCNTDIGDVIVQGGFGRSCESDNSDNFKNTVMNCLNSDLKIMGENAFAYLTENYDVKKYSDLILS